MFMVIKMIKKFAHTRSWWSKLIKEVKENFFKDGHGDQEDQKFAHARSWWSMNGRTGNRRHGVWRRLDCHTEPQYTILAGSIQKHQKYKYNNTAFLPQYLYFYVCYHWGDSLAYLEEARLPPTVTIHNTSWFNTQSPQYKILQYCLVNIHLNLYLYFYVCSRDLFIQKNHCTSKAKSTKYICSPCYVC